MPAAAASAAQESRTLGLGRAAAHATALPTQQSTHSQILRVIETSTAGPGGDPRPEQCIRNGDAHVKPVVTI